MTALKTIAIAFSMFSAIPMPLKADDWNEHNLRYLLCAFPLVGAVSATLFFVAFSLFSALPILRAALLTAIPVLVTGGIHLDGLCDTCDAFFSHASRERKLEIMKDSHAGAFAIIYCALYFLLYFATCAELQQIVPFCAVFVLERQLSALAVAVFPCAKNSGLAKTFSDSSAKSAVKIVNASGFFILSALLIAVFGTTALTVILPCIANFALYYAFSMRIFGGITGDLAGAFLQITELLALLACVIGNQFL